MTVKIYDQWRKMVARIHATLLFVFTRCDDIHALDGGGKAIAVEPDAVGAIERRATYFRLELGSERTGKGIDREQLGFDRRLRLAPSDLRHQSQPGSQQDTRTPLATVRHERQISCCQFTSAESTV